MGSKRGGILQTILGAVLVVVGGITYAYGGAALVAGGVGMMAGGIVQMLSPQPTGLSSKQDADNKPSYAFGSVTNTAAQGYPVPLMYGKRRSRWRDYFPQEFTLKTSSNQSHRTSHEQVDFESDDRLMEGVDYDFLKRHIISI